MSKYWYADRSYSCFIVELSLVCFFVDKNLNPYVYNRDFCIGVAFFNNFPSFCSSSIIVNLLIQFSPDQLPSSEMPSRVIWNPCLKTSSDMYLTPCGVLGPS